MARPKSIKQYELCYLGSVAVGAINTALTWTETVHSAQGRETAAMLGPSFIPLATVFAFTVSLLVWYFTARVPNSIAKWVAVVCYVLSLLGFVLTLAAGIPPWGLSGALTVLGLALNSIAIWLLFRPDSAVWFGSRP